MPETAHTFRVTSDTGVSLQCRRWGDSPRVVVAVHGVNAHGLHWRRLAERLVPRYSLISYDLRGHGDSDKPATGYSYDDHGADLAAVIRCTGNQLLVLIGHSFGARVAIPYAARHRLRGLVIVDPGILPPERRPGGTHPPPRLQYDFESEAAFLDLMRHTNFLRRWDAYNEEYARNLIEPDGHSGVRLKMRPHVHQQLIEEVRAVDLFAFLPQITCPTLVIRATEGHLRADVAERMVRVLPYGRLAVIEGANHNVMLDQPEQFEPIVENFLESLQWD
jgi:pimeloyl-ACP methyl ester carboxylesterase